MHKTRRNTLGQWFAMANSGWIRSAAILSGVLIATLAPVEAQTAYPNKPIKFIVPFPPGSGTDVSARIIAKQLTELSGQPVVVDNRAGANGIIAAQAAATSPADGYTVFVTTMSTQAVNQSLHKKLPYDPQKDFAAVTRFALSPMLLVVRNADDQPRSVAELAERLRKSTTPLNYASGNTSSQVAGGLFKTLSGGNATHVPYKGTPQGLTDLISGQVDFFFPDLTPVVPLVKDGKLRALAVTGKSRVPSLPDLPTMAEAGFPVDLVAWSGAFVPAGTPRAVIDRLNELMRKAMASNEYQEISRRSGTAISPTTPDEFEVFVRDEIQNWGKAVRAAGIEAQ